MHRKDGIITFADYANATTTAVSISTSSTAAAALITTGQAVVRCVASVGANIIVGASGVGAATTANYRLPANVPCYIALDATLSMTHYRVIADGSGTLYLGIVA